MKDLMVGRGRTVRVGSWRGDPAVACIATFIDQPIDAAAVRKITTRLATEGYKSAITAALTQSEQGAFVDNGFEPVRQLALLKRSLEHALPRPEVTTRRWRRRRLDAVLAVDTAAFEPFWRFDETALREALAATPLRTLRVTTRAPIDGYALSGVAQSRGYLQRLAVHPKAAGLGVGTALLHDALGWMRSRGANHAYVNTQSDNERALELYLRNGFKVEAEGLSMLQGDL